MPRTLHVALVQAPPLVLDARAGLVRARELVADAASRGAGLVAFPETWLVGYPIWVDVLPEAALWGHAGAADLHAWLLQEALVEGGTGFLEIAAMARDHAVDVVLSTHERRGGTLFNSLVFASREGGVCRLHRKLLPTHGERLVWGRGDGSTLRVMETAHGIVSGLVCWEHWMPLTRAAMHAKGASVHVAQWPQVKEMNHVASRHYAFEGRCFVLATGARLRRAELLESAARNAAGHERALDWLQHLPAPEDDLLLRGGSAVCGPEGEVILAPRDDDDALVVATIDLDASLRARATLDVDGHYARPDVFTLAVDEREQRSVTFGEAPD